MGHLSPDGSDGSKPASNTAITRSPAKARCLLAAYSEPVFMSCHCSCCSVVDHNSFGCGIVLVLRDKASIEGPNRIRMAMELTIIRGRRKFDLKKEMTTALSTMMAAMTPLPSMNDEWSFLSKKNMVAKRRTEIERPRLRALRWGLRAAKPIADADGRTQSRVARRELNWCTVSIVARGEMPIAVKVATMERSGQNMRPMRKMKSIRLVANKMTSTSTQRAANLRRASTCQDYRSAQQVNGFRPVWVSPDKRVSLDQSINFRLIRNPKTGFGKIGDRKIWDRRNCPFFLLSELIS